MEQGLEYDRRGGNYRELMAIVRLVVRENNNFRRGTVLLPRRAAVSRDSGKVGLVWMSLRVQAHRVANAPRIIFAGPKKRGGRDPVRGRLQNEETQLLCFAGELSIVRRFSTGPKLSPAPEARIPAICLSMALITAPVKVTWPLSTMMWIDGTAPIA